MITVATHSGPFHADDVVACALFRMFVHENARIVRSRDSEVLAGADAVVDVGGRYDPENRLFDHHQQSYEGELSSAGMVLAWLVETEAISSTLGEHLRTQALDYLDAVDTGRVAPVMGVPCFPRMVESLNHLSDAAGGFDVVFEQAVGIAQIWIRGMVADHDKQAHARSVVWPLMDAAAEQGRTILELPEYLPWKAAYFAHDGARHPTEFCCFPGTDGSYRIIAIPPVLGDFGQKRPLPEAWAGLSDAALAEVVGVAGARFCHKNRFIAVFETREAAWKAIEVWGLGR